MYIYKYIHININVYKHVRVSARAYVCVCVCVYVCICARVCRYIKYYSTVLKHHLFWLIVLNPSGHINQRTIALI